MNDKIQLRRGTLANWLKADPILADGEMALVATNQATPNVYDQYKVGGGSKKFSELPYQGLPCLQELGASTTSPLSQKAITDWINKGYQFRGVATPSTNPGTPDGPVFYFATKAGIYANFNSISVADGEVVILQWDNGAWTKKTTGFAAEQEIIYDVSARNGGDVFESLQALLSSSNLNTLIPTSVRRGGMSIRFIQGSVSSSSNTYVQYKLMTTSFSTTKSDWQGVDDEPTAGSNNLVKSGGVRKELDNKFFTFTNQKTPVRKALDGILELYIKLPDSYIGDSIRLQRIDRNYGSSGTALVFWDATKSKHIYNQSPLDEDKNIVSFTIDNVKVYAVVDWSKFPNNAQTTYEVDLSDAVYDVRNSPYIMAYLDDASNRKDIDNFYKDVFTTKANAVTQIESPYKDKRITIIGDSISTFNKTGFTTSGSYYPKNDVNMVEFTWWDKVIGAFGGYSESNLSYGGSTASDACEQHNMGTSLYKRTISDNIGNPDVIIIALGYNDVYWGTSVGNFDYDTPISELSESTFADAYIKGIKSIQNRFPNAEIICVWIGPNTSSYTKHINAIHDIASHYNLPYIVASEYSVIENVHPNKNGMDAIYKKVISGLNVKTNPQKIDELASEVGTLNKEVEDVMELTSDNYHEITEIKSKMAVETQESGAYFTDENGNVFMQYDENGFDVEKISESFKEKLEDAIYSDEGIKKTSEDGVSVVTDALGNSSVYWDNLNGLDTNKVGYNLAQAVKEKYVKNMKEWSNLGIGMFIHWGIYSVLAGHYQGVNIDGQTEDYYSTGIAEWILRLARIPKETYQAYQSQFTAANWDADAVAKMAYDCGMKYIVITVKHHDGFVLYNSDYAPWNLSTSGAGGKDPLMELKTACEKYGLKFCTYFSHQKDWTAEGGWDQGWTNGDVDPYTEAQHKAYIENTINILKEFIGKYDPYVLWYDGDSVEPYNLDLYEEQKNYYPQVITNNRLFNTPQKANYACGEGDYFRGSMEQWKYAENCYTTNDSWGYNERYDISEKTISLYNLICKQILESKARSQNALINIGPKGDGSVSDLTKTLFGELSDYVVKYGTFDNTRGLNYYTFPNWGRAIIKDRTLRCYVWGGNTSILVDGVYTRYIKSVHVWDIQNPESQDNYQVISDYRLQISSIPVNNNYPSLVDIEFGNDIIFEDYSNIIDDTHHVVDASAFQSNSGCSLQSFSSVPQFGGWIGSGNVSSIFLYNGTSGNHNVKLHIPSKQAGSVTITIKVKDIETGTETTLTATDSSTTTSGTVLLTKEHRYRIEVSKTASVWINLSKIEFINQ